MAATIGLLLLPVTGQARGAPDSFADLAASLYPAVVNISTTQVVKGSEKKDQPEFMVPRGSPFEDFFKEFLERNRPKNRGPRRATSLGSGFIIDKTGLVVTNNHVIADADEISVRLSDGTRLKATLVGRDAKTDLALLRVEPKKDLPALKWGDSSKSRVGDWVLAIGNPFGLGGSVTAGIISARGRDINAGPYDDFFQTDASINRGNSGGPLFNMDGEVIGINTAIYSPTGGSVGIGFAIPATLANRVIKQLAEFGRTRRGWLGVRIQTVTEEIAESLGMEKAAGALVAGVGDDGPAGKAGIQQGDVILRFDDQEVDEMRALPRIVANTLIGKTVNVEVWRKGALKTLEVAIAEMEETAAKLASVDEEAKPEPAKDVELLGMRLSALTEEARETFKVDDDAEGVLVLEVAADSSAAQKGLQPGDLIVEVQQNAVESPKDVAKQIKQIRDSNKTRTTKKIKTVLLLVERANTKRFVAVQLDGKPQEMKKKKDEKKE
ncbi:MAG: DegQ family serine endoprotease [Rhodospirillaceae bacterium]|nr:DegQ family serine endoprotease [Rhodospirillaceae bacterium]MBT5193733.1 DegQ family serine endoprotease [Rhodospirillaceae bacterium]MBT5896546.1 DegQ family serine endoprotease [Rhodospirillaceae bacterium]MBT6426391.1 DegQ family serine endoprotease [Rhodospirillaceae bacterium]